MKNVNRKIGAIALAITMVTLFSSCSKQIMSGNRMNKLDNAQALENYKVLPQPKETVILSQTSLSQQSEENIIIKAPVRKCVDLTTIPVKKLNHYAMFQMFAKQTGKEIMKQSNVVKNLVSPNHSIASVSKKMDGGGLLGLAITLLIIGIVLFFLGFSTLGTLFWEIGIVLLVIAIIFFILWMIGRAVSN